MHILKPLGILLFLQTGNLVCVQNNTSNTFLVEHFGAIGDGQTLNTTAIQSAINTANQQGGSTIVFSKGIFLTGSIKLKTNVTLLIEKDAVLLGGTNPRDYPKADFEGRPSSTKKDDNSKMALILAHKASNLHIKGKGTIDGQGLKLALAIDSLHHAGIAIAPNYNLRRMQPKLFLFSECKNILVENLNVGSASCWGLSFELCPNLTLNKLTIVARSYWNNDGIDITDCQNVRITNCDVNSADDGICLKSYYPEYCNDSVYISGCTIRSSASAIKFGSASFGSFKNVTIEDIKVFDTFRSSITGIPNHNIENVTLENIEIEYPGKTSKAMAYVPLSRLEQVPEKTNGYPEFSMFGELPSWAFYVRHVSGISFRNISLVLKGSDFRPAFVFDTVRKLHLQNISIPKAAPKQVILKDVTDVNSDMPPLKIQNIKNPEKE